MDETNVQLNAELNNTNMSLSVWGEGGIVVNFMYVTTGPWEYVVVLQCVW